jgi:predicted Fe-Mo cluster-binding NifX family protein
MRIAISTEGNEVFPHFGRSPVFTIADVVDGRVSGKEIIPNPGHQPGFIPRFLNEKGVQLVITGGMGARAQDIFRELGMETVLGVSGNVDEVIERFVTGTLAGGASLCDHGAGKGHGVGKTVCDHPHDDHHHGN